MPNRKAKDRKERRRKLNEKWAREGRTANQHKKYKIYRTPEYIYMAGGDGPIPPSQAGYSAHAQVMKPCRNFIFDSS